MTVMSTAAGNADHSWSEAERAMQRKDAVTAEAHYRKALSLDAGHVPSLIGLSDVLSRRDAHRDAHAAIMAAWALRPQHPALLVAIAQRLRRFQQFEALEECLANPRLITEVPVQVLASCVVMLSSIGSHDAATVLADAALRRDPANVAATYVRANQHLFAGDGQAAELGYENCLARDPRFLQASWMLASVRKQTSESNHVSRLRQQLSRPGLSPQGAAYVGFALHKELDDLGDCDGAWEALMRGCAAMRSSFDYSVAQDRQVVDGLIQLFDQDFARPIPAQAMPATPIFIVGMHRSGTTLLERMLAGHGQIHSAGETGAFGEMMSRAADHFSPGRPDLELVRRARVVDYAAVAEGYAHSAKWLSGGNPWFTEKLPMNFMHAGFIAKALPMAKILHLQRDPVATCFSNLRTLFSGVAQYSYVQEELADFYVQYQRLMRHWHDVMPGRILDVSHESLVQDPRSQLERICAFCDMPYMEGMEDVSRSGGQVATASVVTVRQSLQTDRGSAWSRYAHQLQPMIARLKQSAAGL